MKSLRMAGLGIEAFKNNFTMLDRPYKLTFSMTYWCQSRCLTCNIWEIKPKGELTLDEIRQFAAKNRYFRWIELTGGEPFLRNDIVEIAKAFVENSPGLYIMTMPTNSLCNQDMVVSKIEQMLDLGIPKLSITLSLDGYRELHDKIRGVPGNFDRVMSMARRLQEFQKRHPNLFFVFGYTMSKFNQNEFAKTYEAVSKEIPGITYNNFHLNLAQLSDIYYENTNLQIKSDRQIAAEEIESVIRNRHFEVGAIPAIENVFLKKLVQYAKSGEVPIKSKSLDASLFMDSYGNVYPSIMWGHKIGNIRESGYDLMPLWHNQEAEFVRTAIKEGKEPVAWTACEAYQSIVGNMGSILGLQ
ncbi:MAG: radical SAM protein [Candidatus Micrarchaeota archaeon]|nr:radical SAM protein [Candidatus Micrarchaeota archaeon]